MVRFSIGSPRGDDSDAEADPSSPYSPFRMDVDVGEGGVTTRKRRRNNIAVKLEQDESQIVPYYQRNYGVNEDESIGHFDYEYRPPPPRSNFGLLTRTIVVLTAISCLFSDEGRRVWLERGGYHVWYVATELRYRSEDGLDVIRRSYRRHWRLADGETCTLTVPSSLPVAGGKNTSSSSGSRSQSVSTASATEEWLRRGLVGQEGAVGRIASALDGWAASADGGAGSTATATVSSSSRRRKPLALLFTGPDGVGKSEAAFLVTELLLSRCHDGGDGDGGAGGPRLPSADTFRRRDEVLVLHGEDFADPLPREEGDAAPQLDFGSPPPTAEELENERLRNEVLYGTANANGIGHREKLKRRVVDHIRSQVDNGGSAVVIISGIERMDASVLDAISPAFDDVGILSYHDERRRRTVKARCGDGRVLFVLSTSLGKGEIYRLVAEHGGRDRVPRSVADSTVRDVLDRHWGGRLNLGKVVNVVVPFLPLGPPELDEILRRKFDRLSDLHSGEYWKRLEVSKVARRRLLGGDFVEYLDLREEESSSSSREASPSSAVLTFSKYGAHTLENGGAMQVVRSAVRRHLGPHRPNKVAVVDYVESSGRGVAMILQEIVIRWCRDEGEGNDTDEDLCEDVWRGLLNDL